MNHTIVEELRHHTPFTAFGAATGILGMALVWRLSDSVAHNIFYILHPAHVFFSAVVTASMYQIHCRKGEHHCNFWTLIFIGYTGSIGISTLSDSLIPYAGELLLKMPYSEPHIGFVEKWWIVNPVAFLGIAVAYFWPQTKVPHALHVLVSTWASLFHILMALGDQVSVGIVAGIFAFLFVAVWFPCCLSDIIFPLLFVKNPRH